MEFSENYEALGKIIVQKLRDENYASYLKIRDNANSKTEEQYAIEKKTTNLDKEFQELTDERFELLSSLTPQRQKILDKLILNILDSAAFNFLKEIEETLNENASLGLTINGKPVESIQPELLSGTFFGEYFLWANKNSNYGEFQQ